MNQKYKVASISEPANALEEQRVKDCKEFNRTIVKLVASSCGEMIGAISMPFTMQMDSYAVIATAFSFALVVLLGQTQINSIFKLKELYNKKGNDEVIDEKNNLGGITR